MKEGEAKVAAIHGSEGAGAAQVRRDSVLPMDDLAADNPPVLRHGPVLARAGPLNGSLAMENR